MTVMLCVRMIQQIENNKHNMFRFYKYCYYRFVSVFNKYGFTDYYGLTNYRNYTTSMGTVSLIQLSNLNTLLIIPVLLLKQQLPAYVFVIILLAILIYNIFILDILGLYNEAKERWKGESPRRRKTNKWLVILLSVVSFVMFFVSIRIVYLPFYPIPSWGNQ